MRRTLFAVTCTLSLVFSWASFSSFRSEEFGKAGYYADSFHGRKTASGEKYDKNELTCAHKSLPFGTKIRVTRLDNKRSVIVRVNDRGPFSEGYVTDVSRKAAQELHLIKAGTTRVKIEVVEKPKTSTSKESDAGKVLTPAEKAAAAAAGASSAKSQLLRAQQKADDTRPAAYSTATTATTAKTLTAKGAAEPAASADVPEKAAARNSELYKVEISTQEKKGFGVQINTLNDADNVLPIISKLRKKWPGKVLVTVENDPTTDVSTYRTILGPFTERNAAEANQKLAEKRGYKKCFVVDLEEM